MKTFPRLLTVVTVAAAGLFSVADKASAQSFEHIDRLALQLRGQADELQREFRQHYRHAAHYNHLISDARQLNRLADHLHDVAHTGSTRHLQSDLNQLDQMFHHLEGLVAEIERDARRGHGHAHGNTRHVRRLLANMEDTLHHLQDDVRQVNRPVPYRGGVRRGSPSIQLGNGRVQFRFGN